MPSTLCDCGDLVYPVAMLNLCHWMFSPQWIQLRPDSDSKHPRFALQSCERLRIRCIVDAIIGCLFGLDSMMMRAILLDCDHPKEAVCDIPFARSLNQKGFWRVDKHHDPELRHTVLSLVAFHDLEEKIHGCGGDSEQGIKAFVAQNEGEGWMVPESLRLADYGLGKDDRANEHQPVASRLGPRFYDWQLAQTPEESWRECHLHARNLLGETGYRQLIDEIEGGKKDEKQESEMSSAVSASLVDQPSLFNSGDG